MQNEINMASIIDNARVTAESSLASKPRGDQSLREVAEQFEAIFLNEFIKQARKAKLADDILGSDAQDTYQEMMDRELSTQLSGRVNLGIAEALVRQLGGESQG
jgi:flagellar protein FlgJ|uniref:Predicted flagellum-specific muramidase n=1 Tax=uncultured bacterium BAC17H8 TaxID=332980 RepID=Q4JMP3_9BACT|nr:predicted flagellum-specific muramidase [uncultured bacterium BAC17H8]